MEFGQGYIAHQWWRWDSQPGTLSHNSKPVKPNEHVAALDMTWSGIHIFVGRCATSPHFLWAPCPASPIPSAPQVSLLQSPLPMTSGVLMTLELHLLGTSACLGSSYVSRGHLGSWGTKSHVVNWGQEIGVEVTVGHWR
jgi:hypothetical protein